MENAQEKKIYTKSYDDVFRACKITLLNLKYNVIETKSNYFFARIGFLFGLLRHDITLYLMKHSEMEIKVCVISNYGYLSLFGHPEKIANKIFSEIDYILSKSDK